MTATIREKGRSAPWKRPAFWPLLTLIVCLVLTGVFWRNAERHVERELSSSFEHRIADYSDRLQRHLEHQALILKGLAGLFNASDAVTRDDFHRYFASLQEEMKDSGYVAMAYLEAVPASDLARHTAKMRQQGFPDYRVDPGNERSFYAPLVYLEPLSGSNRQALGFDPFSAEASRIALERSRDSGSLAVTGKLLLHQDSEEKTPGFVMHLPI